MDFICEISVSESNVWYIYRSNGDEVKVIFDKKRDITYKTHVLTKLEERELYTKIRRDISV